MIIICEPQCIGFEHSEFNAALIKVITYYTNEKILFMAEKEHIACVKATINLEQVTYKEIKLPSRNMVDPLRFPFEFIIFYNVFKQAEKMSSKNVIFCSIRRPGIVSVKLWIRKFTHIRCIMVLHSILEAISNRALELQEIPIWFRFWISFANIGRLKYLVLGPPIKNKLLKEMPKLEKYTYAIDFPYFYQPRVNYAPKNKNLIKFGFFGVGSVRKGVDVFYNIANEIMDQKTMHEKEFILIGHIIDKKIIKSGLNLNSVKVPSPNKPLSRQEYSEYANEIDYAIILHNPNEYKLSAQGSFFDALSYLKPIIAIKNPFIEHYFNELGDIGYLCDDYTEIKNLILKILNENLTEEYRLKKETMFSQRKKLSLDLIGKKFSTIWD